MAQTPGEFIVVVWPGIPPITIPDHPKTEAAALQFIRAGNKVMYRQAGESAAPLTLDDGSAEYITEPAPAKPAARAILAQAVEKANGNLWWLDCGNERHSGQVCIGNTVDVQQMRDAAALGIITRLPAPHVVYPDLIAVPKAKRVRAGASCAELTAAGEQGLMVNRMVAAHALTMLDAFLRGDLKYFALAFDAVWGGASPLIIDQPTLSRVCGVTV